MPLNVKRRLLVSLVASAAIGLALAAALASPSTASERRPTLAELEGEVICPTCHTTLDQSNAPAARRIEAFIRRRIAAGDAKSEIKERLVAQFGPSILAAPPRRGFDLLAWWLPIAGVLLGAAVLGFAAYRWSRGRGSPPATAAVETLTPELEARVDEELARFR
jgi:cytochrome c-type biogenesis protein CcmH